MDIFYPNNPILLKVVVCVLLSLMIGIEVYLINQRKTKSLGG